MKKRVVVTGLGTINPLGNDLQTTWQALTNGQSGISNITKFDASNLTVQVAGEVKNFELSEELIPLKERKKTDTFIQYAVSATQEALNDANLQVIDELSEEIGVAIGVGIGGLETIENCRDTYVQRGQSKITPFFIPKTITNMAAGQISMVFNLKGPNFVTSSACASSNHAIGTAARLIERGDAKVMITGGSESTICPLGISGFAVMKALSTRNDSPATASRPYDKDRDGFVMGEGSGILILEEYEFAKARGAKIYAEVVGFGSTADAYHMTLPSVEGPARAMKLAMKDAGISYEEIDYINAHGTSTPSGDVNEINAIKSTFDKHAYKLSVSSTKSMTGHLLGAAGAIEALFTILAIKNDLVPPTINIFNQDPECDLDITPNQAKSRTINYAISNGFGFGGTNASLLLKKI